MSNLVLDASISLAWLLDDESAPEADAARQRLATHSAYVPRIWHLEMRNALLVAERRGRLSRRMAEERLEALTELPIRTDQDANFRAAMDLARKHDITFYDALYLESALRMTAVLATLDKALARAATNEGLNVLAG